jgi:asparagine synthase (glutamine-hydrolysing)
MHSNGIKVSLDGHGVDEMMYGYPHNVNQALKYASSQCDSLFSTDISDIYLSMLNAEQRKMKEVEFNQFNSGFLTRQLRRLTNRLQFRHKEPTWFDDEHTAGINLPLFVAPANLNLAEAELYTAFHYTVLPTILRNFDRGSMQNSIEIRMPFLDFRIVTFIFSLPMQSKIGGGFTKRILREAMKGILPEAIRTRKLKTGFNAPLQSWYASELRELVLDTVHEKSFGESSYFNGKTIRRFVVKRALSKKWSEQDAFRLWPVLNAHLLLDSKQI